MNNQEIKEILLNEAKNLIESADETIAEYPSKDRKETVSPQLLLGAITGTLSMMLRRIAFKFDKGESPHE